METNSEEMENASQKFLAPSTWDHDSQKISL